MTNFFDYICGADDFLTKWKPQPWIVYRPIRDLKIGSERAIYIGGSELDRQTGVEAAIRVFWVPRSGIIPKDEPRGLINGFDGLESVLSAFSGPQLPRTIR